MFIHRLSIEKASQSDWNFLLSRDDNQKDTNRNISLYI
jgi:hypothetical protein